ncbi:DUF4191 family protein [Actinomyces viscosus]|uniref:Uncharacterized protein n=1 Tax=Actinomyces viscosus TaxID=1656 RepID=A0A3S4Z0F6_ACTVI|nr:DUF4191 domain-containing protein [Actinomyces viscosus]TFH51871.1 DUF4191 family protein [Actinomyces viscosus]VEI14763.1 Uncharacterised protein [Actinomyces viscosus]
MCQRTDVVYCVPVSSAQSPRPRKKNRLAQYLQNIKDSYTISRRSYPWIRWTLPAVLIGFLALGVIISFTYGLPLWYWLILSLMVALVVDMVTLTFTTRRASYAQLEGRPGATKVVLDQIGRGWYVEPEPVAFNKNQDLVWRLVGRPGVVLIAEGPDTRTRRMLAEEERKVHRLLSTVPIHTFQVGTDAGQVRLTDLSKTLRRLPTKPTSLTDSEITQVSKRLTSLAGKNLPIPKHIDPNRVRPDRRAMRGR